MQKKKWNKLIHEENPKNLFWSLSQAFDDVGGLPLRPQDLQGHCAKRQLIYQRKV